MDEASRPNAFERSDADPRVLGALAIGIAVFLGVTPFILFAAYSDAPRLGRIPDNLSQPPQPRLQVAPAATADRLHAREQNQLSGYSWVDRAGGIVSIPIEQAMRLLSERGLSGWPSTPPGNQPPR